ncbi:MAG: histidine kinase [Oscillatoriales cyanobacterium RU_3_3]|nr:histidine kinase [Microcoleus sp. SU_5_6]NJM63528.1 histidine kinase [Oscillatoriales cyanobacterium RU_3_3]NJR21749.1 histidine kinase [Richelia sp. CSU_2_1]
MNRIQLAPFPNIVLRMLGVIGLAIAYYITAELSRHLAATPQDVTPIWPPDGIAVGCVLLFGNWIALGVFLGSFLANIWAFLDRSSLWLSLISTLPVFGIAAGTTLGTLLGTYLLRKSTPYRYPLARVTDVLKFLLLASAVGPIVNATIGVTSLALSGKLPWEIYGSVWLTWWISNVSGIFIIAPVLLSWARLIWKRRQLILRVYRISAYLYYQRRFKSRIPSDSLQLSAPKIPAKLVSKITFFKLLQAIEIALFFGLALLLANATFDRGYDADYLLLPILIWSVFRTGQPGATALTLFVATIATIGTVRGRGEFAHLDLNQSLALLQLFVTVISLTVLTLTAAIEERIQAEKKLRLTLAELAKTNATLEIRVQQRTEELSAQNITLQETLQTLKRTQLQMLQSQMSAVGQLVAGIAHEINNPICFIHGNLTYVNDYTQELLNLVRLYQQYYPNPPETLQEELEEIELDFMQTDLAEILRSMNAGTDRIREIILSLRNFSRLDEAALKKVDIHEGIDSTLMILQHRIKATPQRPEIRVIKDFDSKLPKVECYPGLLNQVFVNILDNAIDAVEIANKGRSFAEIADRSNTIWIHTHRVKGDRIAISITDNGCGVSESLCSRIFDPFFTTKPIGKGTGLGLSTSYHIIIEQHRGKLYCTSQPDFGTKFTIELPVKQLTVDS